MRVGLFRVELGVGARRWARGAPAEGPRHLLPHDWSLDEAMQAPATWQEAFRIPARSLQEVPQGARILAPIESQEVWAAGVTYRRSRDARLEESSGEDAYDRVYRADRPELFFKSAAWRVRGSGEPIGIRRDSTLSVPEPELALLVAEDGQTRAYLLGNDVSSRSIEGENPLYLPQAKVYDGSCSLGPCLVPADIAGSHFMLELAVERLGRIIFRSRAGTGRVKRPLGELVDYLFRALAFPHGAVLMTGTGIVPPRGLGLEAGDTVMVASPRLGRLVNSVVEVGRAG